MAAEKLPRHLEPIYKNTMPRSTRMRATSKSEAKELQSKLK